MRRTIAGAHRATRSTRSRRGDRSVAFHRGMEGLTRVGTWVAAIDAGNRCQGHLKMYLYRRKKSIGRLSRASVGQRSPLSLAVCVCAPVCVSASVCVRAIFGRRCCRVSEPSSHYSSQGRNSFHASARPRCHIALKPAPKTGRLVKRGSSASPSVRF